MRKYRTLVFLLIFSTLSSFSQISVGLKGGFALNNTTNDTRNIDFTSSATTPAFYGGVCANFGVNEKLFLRTEVNYSQKGYAVTKYYDASRFAAQNQQNASFWGTNYTYIQVPILLNYTIENETIKFYFGAGPYFSYAISGKKWADMFIADLGGEFLTQKSVSEPYVFETQFGTDNRKDNRFDLGAVINVGVARKLTFGEVFLEARYEYGFLDWHKFKTEIPKSYSNVMNRGFTFSVGFMFYLKKKSYESSSDETE